MEVIVIYSLRAPSLPVLRKEDALLRYLSRKFGSQFQRHSHAEVLSDIQAGIEQLEKLIKLPNTTRALASCAACSLTIRKKLDAIYPEESPTHNQVLLHDTHTLRDTIDLFGSSFRVEQDKTVEFKHPKIRNSMLAPATTIILRDHHSIHSNSQTPEMVARTCLTYLIYGSDGGSGKPESSATDMTRAVGIEDHSSFFDYATMYWPVHYKLAESHSQNLTGLLQQFLEYSPEKHRAWETRYNQLALPRIPLHNDPPLQVCARFGLSDMARFYLNMGVSINDSDSCTHSPLFLAADSHHLKTVELFLGRDAFINDDEAEDSRAIIEQCLLMGNWQIAKLLLERGAKFRHLTSDGNGPDSWHSFLTQAEDIIDGKLAMRSGGNLDKAIELYLCAMIHYGNGNGIDSDDDDFHMSALNGVAHAFYLQGRLDCAIEWYTRSLEKHIHSLGFHDPATVSVAGSIAQILA